MKVKVIVRGLHGAEFTDLSGIGCRIGESSLATETALWLGTRNGPMLLSQALAAELVPLLDAFAKTGHLPANEKRPCSECNGTGVVDSPEGPCASCDQEIPITCPVCKGKRSEPPKVDVARVHRRRGAR